MPNIEYRRLLQLAADMRAAADQAEREATAAATTNIRAMDFQSGQAAGLQLAAQKVDALIQELYQSED